MKKIISILLIISLITVIIYGIVKDVQKVKDSSPKKNETVNKNTVTYNGWLKVKKTKLLNSKNEEIQLRGISSHGIQWYSELYNYNNIKKLRDTWGINIFRIAMYTDPDADGYVKNKSLKDEVIKIVDEVINLDMYVIIDWHILNDGNPTTYEEEAIEFFDELSLKYKDVPNVIFEICNEPNGNISWNNDVKKYAEKIIEVIRNNSPKSLIIVGIPEWCKDLLTVSRNPLDIDNIMYSVHFYAGTDNQELRNKMDKILKLGLPIFVSECGITDNTGDGDIYEKEFKEWIKYLNKNNISWIFWSLSNKDETSSLLTVDYKLVETSAEDSDVLIESDLNDYLTDTGEILRGIFNSYK